MPRLEWIGKDKVINHHQHVPYHVLQHRYGFLPTQPRFNDCIGKLKFQWQSGTGVAIAPTASQLIPQLEDYFKTHDSITRKEFQQTFGLKRSTAGAA